MFQRTRAFFNRLLSRSTPAARGALRQRQAFKRRKSFLEGLEQRSMLATFHVSLGGLDTNPGTIAAPFRTVQAAINAASNTVDGNDVVKVAAGVYNTVGVDPQLSISSAAGLSNLQLLGGWDAATFTVQNPAVTPTTLDFSGITPSFRYDINVTSPNTKIDGFTLRSSNNTTTRDADNILVDTTGVTISNNILHLGIYDGSFPRPVGVVTSSANVSGLSVLNNQFNANFTGTPSSATTYVIGIFFNPGAVSTNLLVDGNTFQGNNYAAMIDNSGGSNLTISNNTFTRSFPATGFQAISLRNTTALSNISIDSNTFEGNGTGGGITIGDGNSQNLSNISVTRNIIRNHPTNAGIVVAPGTGQITSTIQFNHFQGNGAALFRVAPSGGGSMSINATKNWWGDISGPSVATNPGGLGQVINDSTNISFSPWLIYNTDTNPAAAGVQLPTTVTVTPGADTSAADNAFRRLDNAIRSAITGQTIDIQGLFNWTQPNAAASYLASVANSDTADIRGIELPDAVNNLTITSSTLTGRIIGGGDAVGGQDYESFVYTDDSWSGNGGPNAVGNTNLTIEKLQIEDFETSVFVGWNGTGTFHGTKIRNNQIVVAGDDGNINDFQNIAVYLIPGLNQQVTGNTLTFQGDGTRAVGSGARSFGFQNSTSGGALYDGLLISGNTFQVGASSTGETIYGIWENSHNDDNSSDISLTGNQFLGRTGDLLDRALVLSSQSTGVVIDGNSFTDVDNVVYHNNNSGPSAGDTFRLTNSVLTRVGGADGVFLTNETTGPTTINYLWNTNNTVDGFTGVRGLNELSTQATGSARPTGAATFLNSVTGVGPLAAVYVDDNWGTPGRFTNPVGIGVSSQPIAFGFNTQNTIAAGISAVDAGGNVYIRSGSYGETLDTSSKSVNILPGNSPGQVAVNGIALDSNDTLTLELNGTNPLTEYDNFLVTGGVTLGNATLALQINQLPAGGVFTIINNDTNIDPVSGTFAGLANLSTTFFSGIPVTINYAGGDGNDVVLTIITPTTAYVDDAWSAFTVGTAIADADLGTTGNQPATFGYDAFASVNTALSAVVANGTVIVNGGTYSEAVVSSGTKTIEVTGPDAAQSVILGSLATVAGQGVVLEGSSILTIGNATSTTIGGVVSGSGSLVKTGTGTVTLSGANSYSGGSIVSVGTLRTTSTTGLGTNTATLGDASTGANNIQVTLAANNITNAITVSNNGTGTATIFGETQFNSHTGTIALNRATFLEIPNTGAGTDWWYSFGGGGISGSGPLTIKGGAGGTTAASSGNRVILGGSGSYSGGTTVQSGSLQLDAVTSAGTGSVTLGNASTGSAVTQLRVGANIANTVIVSASAPSSVSGIATYNSLQVLSGALQVNRDVTLFGGSDRLTWSGAGAIWSGGGNITVSGGRVSHDGVANTWSGNLTINASSIFQPGNSATLTSANSVTNNGTLQLNGVSQTINGLSGSGVVQNITGGNTITIGAGGATSTFSGVVQDNSGVLTLTKSGAGTLTLSGNNSYTGITTVSVGTLQLGSATALGSITGATSVTSGAVLDLNGQTVGAEQVTLNGTGISSGGALINSNATAASLSGTIPGNTYSIGGGSGSITLSGAVLGTLTKVSGNTLTLSGTADNAGLAVTAAGGTTILAKTSTAAVHAIGTAGTGLTINSGATVQLGGSGGDQIYTQADVLINSGGILDLNGQNEGFDGLNGAGNIRNTGVAATLTVGEDSTGGSFTGTLGFTGANGLALTKVGSGTLTLGGTNPYTGVTTVSAGTLLVNGTNSGAGAVNVNNSAILGGTGSIAGAVNVNNTARLAPGVSPETLGTGNLTLVSGTFFDVEIGGTSPGNGVTGYDQVNVTGTVSLGNATLNLLQFGGFVVNNSIIQTFTIIDNNGSADLVTGTFNGLPEGSAIVYPGGQVFISYAGGDGNDVVLYSTPTVNGTPGADTLVLRQNSPALIEYSLNGTAFVQVTSTLPFAFIGQGGTDLMLVDTSNGDPIPTGNALFSGEILNVQKTTGAASDVATYVPTTTAGSGSVSITGLGDIAFIGTSNVDFVNLTTVNVQTATVNDALTLAGGNTLSNSGMVPGGYSITPAAALTVSGANAVVGLRNVTNANLTTVTGGGNGNDAVTINTSTGAFGVTNLDIATGTGTDTVTVTGALTVSGTINISSQNIAVNNTLTSGAASTVTLNAGAGAITTSGAGIDVIAQDLSATATTGIELDTTITTLTGASVSGTGAIDISDSAGGLVVTSATTANGAITLNATSGDLTLATVTAAGTARNITATTTTSGNVLVGNLTATSDTISITAVGAIEESGADAASDITSDILLLTAGTGIGAAAQLEIDGNTPSGSGLSASVTGTGIINLRDVDGLRVNSAITNNGSITLEAANGGLTLTTVTAGGAGTNIVANTLAGTGTIALGALTAAGDSVTLSAFTNITDDNAAALNITAATVTANAATGIGNTNAIETTIDSLTATNATSGNIEIAETDAITLTSVVQSTDNNANDIIISAGGTITVGVVNAGTTAGDVTLSATSGSIVDNANDTTADVIGDVVTLTAASGVGQAASNGALDTTANSLDVGVTSAGSIFLTETDAVTLSDVDTFDGSITVVAAGTITASDVQSLTDATNVITLTATAGNVLVDLVNAVGDTIIVNAPGAIEEVAVTDGTADMTASVITLTAVSGIGAAGTIEINTVTTVSRGLTATVTAAGPIDLLDTTGGLRVLSATTANGRINIAATTGDVVIETITSTTDADANDVTVTASSGNILVGAINAGTTNGDVLLTASGSINDVDAINPDITADAIVLLAGTGIGAGDPLETAASNLEASGGTGGVFVANTGALTIGLIGSTVGLSATGGSIVVTTTGAMTVAENVTATGATTNVVLTAIDAVGAGQNFLLNASTTILSAASSVTLNAGDNATINGNITSGGFTTINIDFGDAESVGATATVGDGGTLTIAVASVITTPNTAAGGAYLNSGNDYDTFIFNPQTSTAFFVDGDLPVGGIVGDVLQMNVTGTINPNLTVPGGPTVFNGKAYNGPGSGVWTFDPSHRNVHFKSIEDSQITGPYHLTYDNSVSPVGNLVIMLDGTASPNEQLQFRDTTTAGTILYQTNLTPILSVRVLGGAGADVVTIDDINGLPSFAGSVPASTGVGNHPSTSDTDASPAPEFFFDAGAGTNVLNLNFDLPSTLQQFAFGTGAAPGSLEAEVQTTNAATGLNAYVRNVGEINRTSISPTPGALTVFGTTIGNDISISNNGGGETRVAAVGHTSFDFSGNNYNAFVVNPLAGNDTVDLISFGTAQTNNWPITLNGDADNDTIRVRSTSGNTGNVNLNGNAGDDIFQLYDGTTTAGSVDSIVGAVVVDGTDGNLMGNTDTLVIIDNSDATADSVVISAVAAGSSADYAVEGINAIAGNDVVLRNIDALNYTGTLGNDTIDGRFVNTVPLHDLSTVVLSGWTGADQFLLFTSDQMGGSGAGFTPTGTASGVATINLYGDALGNPNALDGNDIFGATPPGIVGTGLMNVGLVVSDTVRMIRPSVTTALAIDGGQPTGPQPPLGDVAGDKLNLDITALPNTNPVVVSTFAPGTVVALGIASTTWTQIEDMNMVDQGKLTNVQMGDLFARTTPGQDFIQFGLNPTPANPYQVRLRINATITNYSASNKTIIYSGGLNDTITQANLTIPAEFYGEDGDDNISGAIGNDWLVGGTGNDRINGGRGNNVIWGDNSPTTPTDPQPQDTAIGGDDILSGLEGADVFYGGAGNDQVSAGGGNDYANGGLGNDVLDGFDGDDRLYGGAGNDSITGSTGNDLLMGNADDDKLYGNSGNDVLIGGTGIDLIDGGDGNDLLVSGSVANESSSWTSQASAGTFSAATYTNPADNDAALITLLTQWGVSSNRSSIAPITHDGVNDDLFGGLGDDDFCWEMVDVLDNPPGISPPDYNAPAQGTDERFGPT